ncbi:FixH family protein [Rossellomorea vietnamensis]|uniref:FixH family protein n=1 Tax=Rossellomorea vietnamensis TaxID=218284 RepID=UPI001E36128B|nr:FixH family protein [Rossellomorea vietnamensis]MCC5800801.1 FixH family protein [Rossellomorea vietnamensis]
MKRIGMMIAIGVLMILVTACSAGEQKEKSKDQEVLEASIELPEQVEDHKVQFETVVTVGKKPVTDAEVTLNVWKKSGDGEKKVIKAIHQDDGRYVAETDMHEEGIYVVQAMVNADNKEIMPKKQWIYGAISEEEHHQLMQEHDQSGHSESGGHQH